MKVLQINTSTNETLAVELKSEFDPIDRNDNLFSFFPTSIEFAYFGLSVIGSSEISLFWAIRVFNYFDWSIYCYNFTI